MRQREVPDRNARSPCAGVQTGPSAHATRAACPCVTCSSAVPPQRGYREVRARVRRDLPRASRGLFSARRLDRVRPRPTARRSSQVRQAGAQSRAARRSRSIRLARASRELLQQLVGRSGGAGSAPELTQLLPHRIDGPQQVSLRNAASKSAGGALFDPRCVGATSAATPRGARVDPLFAAQRRRSA